MADSDASLAKGTIYLTSAQVVFILAGFFTHLWLGRTLGPKSYGSYGIVLAILTAIHLLQSSGLSQAVTKLSAEYPDQSSQTRRRASLIQLAFSFGIAVPYFLLSGVIANSLGDPSLAPYLRISSLAIPSYSSYAIVVGYYNGLKNYRHQSIMISVYGLIKLGATIVLTAVTGLAGAIFALSLGPITSFLLLGRKKNKSSIAPKTDQLSDLKIGPMIKMSLPFTGFAVSLVLLMNIDLILVKGLIKDPISAGLYTASSTISKLPYFLLTGLALAVFPAVASAAKRQNKDELKRLVNESIRVTLIFLVPSIVLLNATSRKALDFVYGPNYVDGAASLSTLSVGLGFLALFMVLGYILGALGKAWVAFFISTIGLTCAVVADVLLIGRYGLYGAAWGTTIAAMVATVIAFMMVSRYVGAVISIKSLVRIASSGSVIIIITYFSSVLPLFLQYMLIMIFFVALLFASGEVSKDDFKMIKNMSRKSTTIDTAENEV